MPPATWARPYPAAGTGPDQPVIVRRFGRPGSSWFGGNRGQFARRAPWLVELSVGSHFRTEGGDLFREAGTGLLSKKTG